MGRQRKDKIILKATGNRTKKLCPLMLAIPILFAFNLCLFAQDTTLADKEMRLAIEDIVGAKIPGLSVAIANKEGIIWSGAAGHSNFEDNKTVSQSHLFGIGNITNNFIAVVILQLAAENRLDLNSTSQSILGESVSEIDNADKATLLQLLNHTSGIYSWDHDADWARRGRGVQMNPKYKWAKNEPLKYISRNRHKATNEPGMAVSYSKSNYTLLGLIVEKITERSIEDEVRARILDPLSLKDTYYESYEYVPDGNLTGSYHLATGEFITKIGINAKFNYFDHGDNNLINTSGASLSAEGIAGGIVSTPRDLAIFATALKGGKLINEQALSHIYANPAKSEFIGIHSGILGYTSDMYWLENNDLVIVSLANIGVVGNGKNETSDLLDNYVEKILLPIALKYVNNPEQ
ncbi:MAG: serine hydrolase [Proteobacteria bacterium]|jgi:D-alanyl-D-alanine carboxypeptidase|nr:serine hydrolase [Pseudomonadota bacterium]